MRSSLEATGISSDSSSTQTLFLRSYAGPKGTGSKTNTSSPMAGLEGFTNPKTSMFFADAKKALSELTDAVKTLVG